MKIGRIIHQQMMQLRWHFLASLGLIMVLPLEECVVNLKDSAGFYSAQMVVVAVLISPLLAGLIACANVQADLDEKHYIFWRSKPVGVKKFMALKYVVGMTLSMIVIASPLVFSYISTQIYHINEGFEATQSVFYPVVFVAAMAYSLCFLCNVLVRKTARAWLIGMTLACFLLLVPFILPLNFKGVGDILDYFFNTARPSIQTLILFLIASVPSLLALLLSLIATDRNWHLQTNLKGLLWTGAALIFLIIVLFTHQVANIRVLDEVAGNGSIRLEHYGDSFVFGDKHVSVQNNHIILNPTGFLHLIHPHELANADNFMIEEGFEFETYPYQNFIFHEVDGQMYAFSIYAYYKVEKEEYKPSCFHDIHIYKNVYLRSFKVVGSEYIPASTLDLSDCLKENSLGYMTMRLIGDKIIAFVGDQCLTVVITHTGGIEVLNRHALKRYSYQFVSRDQIFKVPLVPTEAIDIQDRIRLSIDFNSEGWFRYNSRFVWNSLVDIHNNKINLCWVTKDEVARYTVVKWDDGYIYCKFRDARPFTFLEKMFGFIDRNRCQFVQNGKLYFYSDTKLMVFDVRSEHIRKLGHFERISNNFWIGDVEVLKDGNMLMAVTERKLAKNPKQSDDYTSYLYLLKNPE